MNWLYGSSIRLLWPALLTRTIRPEGQWGPRVGPRTQRAFGRRILPELPRTFKLFNDEFIKTTMLNPCLNGSNTVRMPWRGPHWLRVMRQRYFVYIRHVCNIYDSSIPVPYCSLTIPSRENKCFSQCYTYLAKYVHTAMARTWSHIWSAFPHVLAILAKICSIFMNA